MRRTCSPATPRLVRARRCCLDAPGGGAHALPNAGLGLLTCATALLAQFYPTPFPENYWLLVACVVVYFSLNTALQVRRRGTRT